MKERYLKAKIRLLIAFIKKLIVRDDSYRGGKITNKVVENRAIQIYQIVFPESKYRPVTNFMLFEGLLAYKKLLQHKQNKDKQKIISSR